MTPDPGLRAWLALSQVPGLGTESFHRLLSAFGSPDNILAAPVETLRLHVKPAVANSIHQQPDEAFLDTTFEWLQEPKNRILTLSDEDYPQSLLNIPDPPYLLYIKGRTDLLNHASLAVVGSRNATTQGLRNAQSFSQHLSEANYCIVSGLAQGIDGAAHVGGLHGCGSSVAVVGTGLDRIYPASNRELAHQLAESGTIISEFALGTPPLASNFPRRNRIISGLSLGCLVVEASLQSGSLITARMALEQGRDVFAIPGSIHSPQSRGCHSLIKQGAKLVESPQDILDEFGFSATPAHQQSISVTAHTHFLDRMGYEPIDLDTLLQLSNLTIEELSAILLQLELDGLISVLAGGKYQRIV